LERASFLVAGVQKGGTTALFSYLSEHPELTMAPEKEVHFFDDETQDWARPDYDDYHRRLAGRPGAPAGEATPIYIYWPNSLERIAAYNPAVRLVLLFRDPIERAWSHWRMEHARGAETEPFGWCIRQGRDRLLGGESPGFHRVHSYVERGLYGAQLQRLYGLFPREQVLPLHSDDLKHAPGEVIRRVSDFLGVAAPDSVESRRVHVGEAAPPAASPSPADLAHLRMLFSEDLCLFSELSGLDVRGWAAAEQI
jgi:hypothetical protein